MTKASFARTTICLTEAQRALRALRPSYTSTRLPVRLINLRTEAFMRDASGYCLIPVERVVPVFERVTKNVAH